MEDHQLLIKALMQRKQFHHVDAISRVVEREKERRELILGIYQDISTLRSKCVAEGLSIALREIPTTSEGECTYLTVDAVFVDTVSNKWFYTLTSSLPAHQAFFERIKFSLELFPSLVHQELGFKLTESA